MLNLQDREWKAFLLSDIFPDIQRGKRLKKGDHTTGAMPYVSSTAMNNGVDGFVGNKAKVRRFDNCLTLANSGSVGKCFFQPYSFVASDHVTKLKNEDFSKYIYLFISAVVSRLSDKYSFNREINDTRIKREIIMLPITRAGEPDYGFMEDYIKERETLLIKQYQAYISSEIAALSERERERERERVNEPEWGSFLLGTLFRFEQGKSKGLNHLTQVVGGINYLGATNRNNGVLCSVEPDPKMVQAGNCIAFIRNGEGSMGYSVYKAENFIATSDISAGYNENLNRYNGLFITAIADRARGKYNFGHKRSDTRLKKETLMLPKTPTDEPDWQYMEDFVKQREYALITQYLEYKTA